LAAHAYPLSAEYNYKRARDAPEISGWPRVKDQDCQLDAAGQEMQLRWGTAAPIEVKEVIEK
jgi:hypothetical protein